MVGAIIERRLCLDLVDAASLNDLRDVHAEFEKDLLANQVCLPENRNAPGDEDLLLRYLDCAVINYCHFTREAKGLPPYDSVRGVFLEGGPLFRGAAISAKTHIHVCVRDRDCLRGYFRPRLGG